MPGMSQEYAGLLVLRYDTQDFIHKIRKRGAEDTLSRSSSMSSLNSDVNPVSFEIFTSLLESYEAKKKSVPFVSITAVTE